MAVLVPCSVTSQINARAMAAAQKPSHTILVRLEVMGIRRGRVQDDVGGGRHRSNVHVPKEVRGTMLAVILQGQHVQNLRGSDAANEARNGSVELDSEKQARVTLTLEIRPVVKSCAKCCGFTASVMF